MAEKTYVPTAAEQSVLDYHRKNLYGNTFLQNPDGSLTTFMGAIVGTPSGHMLLPTYWHGQVRDIPDAMRFAIRSGINFPTYKTPQEAEDAEQRLHGLMEQDTQKFMQSKK